MPNQTLGAQTTELFDTNGLLAVNVEAGNLTVTSVTPAVLASCSNQASTSSFTSVLSYTNKSTSGLVIQLHEHNTAAIDYQVIASMDGVNWVILNTPTKILQNGTTYETLSDQWIFIQIQIKDDSSGTHGGLDCTIGGI